MVKWKTGLAVKWQCTLHPLAVLATASVRLHDNLKLVESAMPNLTRANTYLDQQISSNSVRRCGGLGTYFDGNVTEFNRNDGE